MTTIVVIDDSLTIRTLVSLALTAAGYKVHLSSCGEAGIADAIRLKPALVLLDFRLPDLRAEQVCATLASNPATAQTPIVLMSARADDVRSEMKSRANAVDFISKPFSGPALLERLEKILKSLPQKSAPKASPDTRLSVAPAVVARAKTWSFQEKQQAAKALFAKLRVRLASIPEALKQVGEESPAVFIARTLLTPDTVEDVLSALAPLFDAPVNKAPAVDALVGTTKVLPLFDLLRMLASLERDGELEVRHGSQSILLALRKGVVLHVTSTSVVHYLEHADLDTSGVPDDVIERANEEQQRTGKPIPLTLTEAGFPVVADVDDFMHRRGMRLMQDAANRESSFRFTGAPIQPYVESHGRAISQGQLDLQRLREEDAAMTPERIAAVALTVFRRATGFSQRIRQLALEPSERIVATLADGHASVRQLAARSGRPERDVVGVAFRLAEVGLLSTTTTPAAERPWSVQIAGLSTNIDDVLSGLEEVRTGTGRRMKIARSATRTALVERVGRGDQKLALASGELPTAEFAALVADLRALDKSGVPLVAIIDVFQQDRADALLLAGAAAVLSRPVHIHDIEALLE